MENVRNNEMCVRGKTWVSNKHSIHGLMLAGKASRSNTLLHMGGARQRVTAAMPYMGVCWRVIARSVSNHARYGEANHIVPASTAYVIHGGNGKFCEASRSVAKQNVAW